MLKKIVDNLKERWITYAFETLVVVVGILIAFGLNNWNENRKVRKSTEQLIRNLAADVRRNNSDARDLQVRIMKADTVIKKILNKEATSEMYKEMTVYPPYLWVYGADFRIDNLKKALSLEDLFVEKYHNLFVLLKSYSNAKVDSQWAHEKTDSFASQMNMELAIDTPWFAEWYRTRTWPDDAISYFLNDPTYLGRVQMYSMRLVDNQLRILEFRIDLEAQILQELDKLGFEQM